MATSQAGPTTVQQATAKLWTAQEPRQVVKWLRILRNALLQDDINNCDPSDIFLAIQSSSIRFENNNSQDTNTSETNHHPHASCEELWLVLLESTLTTSTLARVCVGPAWWNQNLQRGGFRSRTTTRSHRHPNLRQTTPTTLPDDSSSNLDAASLTESGHSVGSWAQPDSEAGEVPSSSLRPSSPICIPIPEILPAAMLRFAANAVGHADDLEKLFPLQITERMKLIEAQLSILQHLCCAVDHDRDLTEWNIPGAHGIVGIVLASSLRLVCTGRSTTLDHRNSLELLSFVVDDEKIAQGYNTATGGEKKVTISGSQHMLADQWKHILLVTHATTDLMASGWRLLPVGTEGYDVLLSLLVLASRGIKLDDTRSSREDRPNYQCST